MLIYKDFYKTTLSIYKANEIINQYKKNHNPIILSSKISIVNNIIKALNTEREVILTTLVVYSTSSQEVHLILAIDKMFSVKYDFSKSLSISLTTKV